jgi:hypothetical protein
MNDAIIVTIPPNTLFELPLLPFSPSKRELTELQVKQGALSCKGAAEDAFGVIPGPR